MILVGDAIEMLRTLKPDSVDSIVTDPPYELGFMGKSWDATGIAYSVELWREALRVLKPGGHLLAFSGSRTYHRMAVAIEDAGFEIRDQIMWVYSSGFPKSLDVSKAIDKMKRREYVLAAIELGLEVPGNNLHDWTKAEHSPGDVWWNKFKNHLSESEWLSVERNVIGKGVSGKTAIWSDGGMGDFDITTSATPEAKQWEGWGTALKPSHEPICVARKPLIGTVAQNVLTHGTGAMNIDGCRIHTEGSEAKPYTVKRLKPGATLEKTGGNWRPEEGGEMYDGMTKDGRWPANFIHDGSDEVVGLFPAEAGAQGKVTVRNADKFRNAYGEFKGTSEDAPFYGDSGSAARFFYCAKAAQSERGYGNHHPTVKPIALMRYLCRLVTPPGGTVLDMFAGSGTTGCAAKAEGFKFVLIERESEYVQIIEKRLGAITPAFDFEEVA